MKSRTSFSKLTPLRKDLTRYTPLWALYFIGMMLVLLANGGRDYYDEFAWRIMDDMVDAFALINIIYAGLCAMALFGDLFNTKLCYSLHAMPQRRESWLVSHLSAGMLFSLVPNMVAALFLMLQLQDYWFLALYWLLASTLQFLFFFGIGSFSAMLTGNRIAMVMVYVGINFMAMLAYATVDVLYIPMLTGVVVDTSGFSQFSPVAHLMSFVHFRFDSVELTEGPYQTNRPYYYEYLGLGDGWGYMAILGVVGLVAMAAAWLLYRKRHLEVAGDFVAFPRLKGIACVLITVCAALCFALLGKLFGEDGYGVWVAVGLVIGFFGGLMLLERRIKVFRKKTFLGFALLAVTLVLSFTAMRQDWFGIVSYTPKAEKVASVTIHNFRKYSNLYDYDYYFYSYRISVTLTEQEDIEAILQAHEDILAELDTYHKDTHRVTIEYTLNSGRTVTRSYSAPADGLNYEIFNRYFFSEKQLLGYGNRDWEDFVAHVKQMDLDHSNKIPSYLWPEIMEALRKDCATGGVRWNINDVNEYRYNLHYYVEGISGDLAVERYLFITEQAENLCALLQTPEVQMGYADWETYLRDTGTVTMDGSYIQGDDRIALLEAIRKDVEAGTLCAGDFGKETLFLIYCSGDDSYREFCVDKYAEHTVQWIKDYYARLDESNPEGV